MKRNKIRVMISSRCNDKFPVDQDGALSLTDIRRQIKKKIEGTEVFGKPIFEVWINEDSPPIAGNEDSWDACLQFAKDADILLVLFNGHAGWTKAGGEIGICHAELMTALTHAPGKVFLISMIHHDKTKQPEGSEHARFRSYVSSQNLFRGEAVSNLEQLSARTTEALREALVTMAQRGVRESSKGRFHTGQALDWSRLDFAARSHVMKSTVTATINQRSQASDNDGSLLVTLGGQRILIIPNAIPAALSVAAAREMVGQPFLRDHEHAAILSRGRIGPVHIIACHKGVTETQAMALLGFPDATLVTTPFGVYASDNIQNIQLILIANCRDETTTRHGVQRLFEWLEQTGEDKVLAGRAKSRTGIVKAIAKEYRKNGTGSSPSYLPSSAPST